MSRFLSKAKRIDNGKWVTGYYTKEVYEGLNIETTHTMAYQETFVGRDEKGIYIDTTYADIDIKTLCSCIGGIDKNGKLVFENDIIKKSDDVYIIRFDNRGCYLMENINNSRDTSFPYLLDRKKFEVIGNIYDKGDE